MRAPITNLRLSLASVLVLAMFGLGLIPAWGAITAKEEAAIENTVVYGGKTVKELITMAPAGAVSWKTLKGVYVDVKETKKALLFIPEFNAEVSALDGREIEIEGFVFPLTPTDDGADFQSRFLLSSLPPSCPYYHLYGMEQIIEVVAAKPVPFVDDPVRIKGRFELLRDNRDGLFYKMTGARMLAN